MKYLILLETPNETAEKVLRWWIAKPAGVNWDECQIVTLDQLSQHNPTIALITLDPARLPREITPLTLCIEDLKKARDFVASGETVVVCCGGKPAKALLGYGANAAKWRGSYQRL